MPFTAHKILLPDGQLTCSEPVLADSGWMQATRRLLKMFYPHGPQGRSIVDLGCLEGGYTLEFAKMGWQATGIEVRQTNFDNCQIVQRAFGLPNLHFVRDDVLNLEKYGPFDVIFCCGLLYHLENPGAFIEMMGRQARDAVIIHTNFATPERCLGFPLSDMTVHEGLPGRWFEEHQLTEHSEIERERWASWTNQRSFWPTRGAILEKLNKAGFDVVFEPADWMPDGILHSMTRGYYALFARGMFVGVRTQRLGVARAA